MSSNNEDIEKEATQTGAFTCPLKGIDLEKGLRGSIALTELSTASSSVEELVETIQKIIEKSPPKPGEKIHFTLCRSSNIPFVSFQVLTFLTPEKYELLLSLSSEDYNNVMREIFASGVNQQQQ